jgi:hypothetical protein
MTVQRLVWIVVIVLIVAVAFVGGFALATWNGRVAYGRAYGFAPGFGARGFAPSGVFTPTVPFTRTVPFGYAPGARMQPGFGMGYGRMPGYGRGGGLQPRFVPGNGMRGTPRSYGRVPTPRTPRQLAPGNRRGGWR